VLALAVIFLFVQHYLLPARTTQGTAAVPEKSVAVLPFENLSDEKSSAYFASGIQDEILTRLAKIGALKVISRTSTQHYASSPENLPEIARQRRRQHSRRQRAEGRRCRHINVQLIRAATDDHLWAEVYNRRLDDIFVVEAEVAGAIADTLNAKLSGAEQAAVTTKPTENLAAYDAFLRARALSVAGYDFATTRKVAAAYTEAVRLDPDFAVAWANLARTAGYLYFNGVDPDVYTADLIKRATDTAVRLQPQNIETLAAQGSYQYRIQRDFPAAERASRRIVERQPNFNDAWQFLGLVERRQGKWEGARSPRRSGEARSAQRGTVHDNRRRDAVKHASLRRGARLAEPRARDCARRWLGAVVPGQYVPVRGPAAGSRGRGGLDAAGWHGRRPAGGAHQPAAARAQLQSRDRRSRAGIEATRGHAERFRAAASRAAGQGALVRRRSCGEATFGSCEPTPRRWRRRLTTRSYR
jgi:TolB-like protein